MPEDHTFEFLPSGDRCNGCGSTNAPHEYDGENWCDGCLQEKKVREMN